MARTVLELPAADPVAIFAPLADDPLAVLLDSAAQGDPRSRYSYIAADPVDVLVGDGTSPFPHLAARLAARHHATIDGLPPFQGGFAGWLSYDLGRHLERLPPPPPAQPRFPDCVLGEFNAVAAFDHQSGQAWVIGEDKAARHLRDRLMAAPALPPIKWRPGTQARPDLPRQQYQMRVAQVVDYIRAGDVFQANLAQRFTATAPAGLSPFTLYRRMRQLAPGPFSAFVAGSGCALAAVSPERFLSVDSHGQVETRPIKGTRPRHSDSARDRELAAELTGSAKDRAENLMILDLMRNDLSRVCAVGSVHAPQRMALESFPAIHHLVSVVAGRLRPDQNAVDLLQAAFPPGSITGAPKIRAMEIIAQLETAPRGPYCGAYGWIGDDGAMDLAVAIRVAAWRDGQVAIHAGGGITADSDPVAEYDETLVKAGPILRALAGEAS
ncbi:aminodeoxychorismate synthase component I [Magnetospirillum sp. 64-120]|uniref:aminodeoxychorismate synthase component I n=1 Tax=Magnetospirillum sp. 64-120 TaxID=1895778 RepID=UPI00092C3B56|nr:aminodeoxychorismate synthase component I [Magnetospirillum sp. 64-120]OJX71366.1 MAG: aminodeoxychorismate synthase, component I [Magnetospirillum sp. 64-120]